MPLSERNRINRAILEISLARIIGLPRFNTRARARYMYRRKAVPELTTFRSSDEMNFGSTRNRVDFTHFGTKVVSSSTVQLNSNSFLLSIMPSLRSTTISHETVHVAQALQDESHNTHALPMDQYRVDPAEVEARELQDVTASFAENIIETHPNILHADDPIIRTSLINHAFRQVRERKIDELKSQIDSASKESDSAGRELTQLITELTSSIEALDQRIETLRSGESEES